MRTILAAVIGVFALAVGPAASAAETGGIVVSIKPVHSLVAAVMAGTGVPHLLIKGSASPHTYSLKPSDARALEAARLIFWIGPGMESALGKPIRTLGSRATVIRLSDAPGLIIRPFREGGPFTGHAADATHRREAEHENEAAHDHGRDNETEHEREDEHERGHGKSQENDGDHRHAPGTVDMHLWLDPINAGVLVEEIAAALSAADPVNASRYRANAEALSGRLRRLTDEIAAALAAVRDRPFLVFHDAYQYFERRFGLAAAGSITVSPAVLPGARRLGEIRRKVAALGATCVFAEPQFPPRLIRLVTDGTPARTAVLDPLGTGMEDGPDLYFTLLRRMAASFADCLGGAR